MFSITLSYWLPYFTGLTGFAKWTAWMFWLETRPKNDIGLFGIRIRILGVCLSIEVITGTLTDVYGQLTKKIEINAVNVDKNGKESEVTLEEKVSKWVAYLTSKGVGLVVKRLETLDATSNSFVLSPMPFGITIGIGDKIAFGDPDGYKVAEVTGSRALESGDTLYYGKLIQL